MAHLHAIKSTKAASQQSNNKVWKKERTDECPYILCHIRNEYSKLHDIPGPFGLY